MNKFLANFAMILVGILLCTLSFCLVAAIIFLPYIYFGPWGIAMSLLILMTLGELGKMSNANDYGKAIDIYNNLYSFNAPAQQLPFFGLNRNQGGLLQNYTPPKYTLTIPTPEQVAAAKLELARLEALIPEYNLINEQIKLFNLKAGHELFTEDGEYPDYVNPINEQKNIISRSTHTWNVEDQKCSKCNSNYWICENGEYTCDEMIVKNIIE